jgi:hypothetical protein
MRKHIHKLKLLGAVLAVALVSGSTVLALPSRANVHAQATNDTSVGSQTTAQTKLTEAKLRVCQNRQHAITNIMARIADRGQKQLTLFSTIASRTETFYTDKGKTLSNYDALVADVTAKAATAQTAVDTIKSDSTGFSCDGSDPKGFVASFKDSLKSEISALQAYRTSVKNLIVGVKSVQSTTPTNQTDDGGNQ